MNECERFTPRYIGETLTSVKDNQTGEVVDIEQMINLLNELNTENEHYKAMFFEIVETALTDKNCRQEYCKGILNIFDECNDLNEARKQIMEFLE